MLDSGWIDPLSLVIWKEFEPIVLKNMDRAVSLATYVMDQSPYWLVKVFRK